MSVPVRRFVRGALATALALALARAWTGCSYEFSIGAGGGDASPPPDGGPSGTTDGGPGTTDAGADGAGPGSVTLTVVASGTGKGTVRSADLAIDCGATCSHAYLRGSTVDLSASALLDATFTGWEPPCSGTGPCGVTMDGDVTIKATFAATILDVDANRAYDGDTDGLLVTRYLFGTTGPSLTQGAIGPNALRSDPDAIVTYLNGVRPQLDIDGDGNEDALTDGLLVTRYLKGLRGSALTQNAVASGATRSTQQIEDYLKLLTPPL